MTLYEKVGEIESPDMSSVTSSQQAQKKHSKSNSSSESETSSRIASPLDSARLFINKRVAKKFVGDIFYGTVIDCYEASSEHSKKKATSSNVSIHKSTVWRIRFDDGDEEYFTKDDLIEALKL